MKSAPILAAKDVQKSFGATPALCGATVEIQRGEVLAIMGPSGSGKTTLLHCLAGILLPDAGHVLFHGSNLETMSDSARTKLRRSQFGFVFQFGQLIPELTALENIAFPLLLNGQSRKLAFNTAAHWMERLGLSESKAQRAGELSGGQAQRVAIARAMAIRPTILFADEPTGSLDSLTSERAMVLFLDTVRSSGTTLVIVTHDPRIAAYADREIIVRDGIVVTTGRGLSDRESL
ncbi:MAG: ABC transporter ATP-binding protein [Proteobacteria bacterium]|nr:MAG: ABC transporter ATP-binding protein [Pseudomonadota bacterium]